MTRISMATARVATAWPIRPRPTMPSVLPANCVPMNFLRSQRPSTRLWWAAAMFRTRPYIRASVCSAVEIVLPPGVFMTTMPCRVAALVSMLSTPTPARAMALRRWLPCERFGGDLHAAAADRAVELRQGRFEGLALESRADFDFNVGGRSQQIQAVVGKVVQNDDSCHGSLPGNSASSWRIQ